MTDLINLYNEYYVERGFERLGLFQLMEEKFHPQKVLYPGSFVHITPSFVFPRTTYLDSDKKAKRFFEHPALMQFLVERKRYERVPKIEFHALDFTAESKPDLGQFDLMISQYAGFISQHCKRYLSVGGLLLVNNSHGDASMASIDEDYQLVAVLLRGKRSYRIEENNLKAYFVLKKPQVVTRSYIEEKRRGLVYIKAADSYLFKKIRGENQETQ